LPETDTLAYSAVTSTTKKKSFAGSACHHVDVPVAFFFTQDIEAEFAENVRSDEAGRIDETEFHVPGVNRRLVLQSTSLNFYGRKLRS